MELAVTEDADDVARELDGRLDQGTDRGPGRPGEIPLWLGRRCSQGAAASSHRAWNRRYTSVCCPATFGSTSSRPRRLWISRSRANMDGVFSFEPARLGAMDPLLSCAGALPREVRGKSFCLQRRASRQDVIWLHPGEPVFERFRSLVSERLATKASAAQSLSTRPADRPYLFHLALLSSSARPNPADAGAREEEVLGCRLVGVKQYEGTEISLCPG